MTVGEGIIIGALALLLIVGSRPKAEAVPKMATPKPPEPQPALAWLPGRGATP